MSRVACVWADLGDDAAANEWYEDAHIPDVVGRLDAPARNAENAKNDMFGDQVATLEGTSMTVYDLPGGDDASHLDAQMRPAMDKLSADARFDTRCYTEFASWHGNEWRGDARDIQMWIVVRWQPSDAVYDEVLSWFRDEFVPGMLGSPELLRARLFKLENASLLKDQRHEQQHVGSMYQYLTLWEFDCDELPWEILVYLGSSERWRHYVEGGHFKWQISQYLVNRIYPEDADTDSPATKRASVILSDGMKVMMDESDEKTKSDDGDESGDFVVLNEVNGHNLIGVNGDDSNERNGHSLKETNDDGLIGMNRDGLSEIGWWRFEGSEWRPFEGGIWP